VHTQLRCNEPLAREGVQQGRKGVQAGTLRVHKVPADAWWQMQLQQWPQASQLLPLGFTLLYERRGEAQEGISTWG
jgi:hypothetical protein